MPEDNPVDTITPKGEGDTHVDGTNLTLDQLNEKLGTRYQSVESALKGLKETKDFVGKAGQVQKQPEVDLSSFVSKEQYEQDMFYAQNSDLIPYKDIINARAKELNLRPADAVNTDGSLKNTLEKLRGFDKTESAKSVLMNNQRLGEVTDHMQEAYTALKGGNIANAENLAVKAALGTIS